MGHGGYRKPYTTRLSKILGLRFHRTRCGTPDAVLRVEDIEHAPITRERVDKAAAVQLVFEDALVHLVGHWIQKTGSHQLVLTAEPHSTAWPTCGCLEYFDEAWFERYLGKRGTRLHLWVPPVPNDEGIAAGAAIQFACQAGVPVGRPETKLNHVFWCGLAPSREEIQSTLQQSTDIGYEVIGKMDSEQERLRIADLLADIICKDGVVGIFHGAAETGPRALGHRSILANPANTETLKTLNSLVKFREIIRPLAPMSTLESAKEFFELSPGACDDDYNAYNYMILTAPAKPQAYETIPAVVHHDGTSRVQIVRQDVESVLP